MLHSRPAHHFLSPDGALEGRHCFLAPTPTQLPSVAQLIDSTRVHEFLAREADLPGSIVATIGYDPLSIPGANLPVIDATNVSGGSMLALVDSLEMAVRETAPLPVSASADQAREQSWSVLLRIDLGPPLALRVGRTELCSPDLMNGDAVAARIGPEWRKMVDTRTDLPESLTLDIQLEIDTTGTVQAATVRRSAGILEVDRLAQSMALHAQFLPALRNRKRLPVRVMIPFQLSGRLQPPQPLIPDCVATPARPCR